MAWLTKRGDIFYLGLRFPRRVFRTSLKTADKRSTRAAVARVGKTSTWKSGRLTLPRDVRRLPTFLLSDGRLSEEPSCPDVI